MGSSKNYLVLKSATDDPLTEGGAVLVNCLLWGTAYHFLHPFVTFLIGQVVTKNSLGTGLFLAYQKESPAPHTWLQ